MARPERLPVLLEKLEKLPDGLDASKVDNFYLERSRLNNLRVYFHALVDAPYSGDLLVGEAPGYAGCARTGIPFTSESVVAASPHPLLVEIRSRMKIFGCESEATATIVWDQFSKSTARIPAFWNAFPFHPHKENGRLTNRTPSSTELVLGTKILELVIDVLEPKRIFAVGRKAEAVLDKLPHKTKVIYIRHPSRGGKSAFIKGLSDNGIL